MAAYDCFTEDLGKPHLSSIPPDMARLNSEKISQGDFNAPSLRKN